MNFEDRKSTSSAYERFRSSLHIGMGLIYLLMGSAVLYVKYFGAIQLESGIAYTLGSMMVLYGVFRLWRGITFLIQRKNMSK